MTDTHGDPARDACGNDVARDAQSGPTRDARGRFQPGQSGNPAGKKPGTLNHATRWRHLFADGDFDTVAGQVLEQALKGKLPAARIVLDRVDPKPRGRPVTLAYHAGDSVLHRFIHLWAALADGEVTPEEARTIALVLDLEGRERARGLATEQALMRNRGAYNREEFHAALKRLDAMFPPIKWYRDDEDDGSGAPEADTVSDASADPSADPSAEPDADPAFHLHLQVADSADAVPARDGVVREGLATRRAGAARARDR